MECTNAATAFLSCAPVFCDTLITTINSIQTLELCCYGEYCNAIKLNQPNTIETTKRNELSHFKSNSTTKIELF